MFSGPVKRDIHAAAAERAPAARTGVFERF